MTSDLASARALLSQALALLSDGAVNAVLAPSRDVLSTSEAAIYVGKKTLRSFQRWKARHQVRGCGFGRYSKAALDAALSREARKTYRHTTR